MAHVSFKKVAFILILFLLPLSYAATTLNHVSPITIFQAGSLYNLFHANYKGTVSFNTILQHGNWGLGSSQGFVGELVIADGKPYLADNTSHAKEISKNLTTPYAIVIQFHPENTFKKVAISSIQELQNYIMQKIPNKNVIYAVKITTIFKHIEGRSFPPVPPHFPSDKWIDKMQKIYKLNNVKGTAIGFITPEYLSPLMVPKDHFHFITSDRKRVFHLYDMQFEQATIEVMQVNRVEIETDI